MKKCIMVLFSVVLTAALIAGCAGQPTASPTEPPAAMEPAEESAPPAEEPAEAPAPAEEAPAPESEEPTELHIAMGVVPTNLDIVMNTADDASQIACGPIFEQLVAMNNQYEPVAELATDWVISEDATTYTYHLRQGILFHNGQEMKAADVVASMNRWIEAADNAKTLVGDARFYEVDEYTVEIQMAVGTPYLNLMIGGLGQHAAIMPASVIEAADAETGLISEYIGTGPYVFDNWVEDQYIKLVRNENYQPYGVEGDYSGWAGYKHAYIDSVYFDFVADANTIVAGLQTGEYDVADSVSNDNYTSFATDENYYIVEAESELPALIFNKAEGWGANAKFRQAVAALLNIDDIMFAAYSDPQFYNLYSSYMFESQTTWYTDRGSEYYNAHDTEKAMALFEEAGFTADDTFILLVASDSPDFYSMAIVIQNQFQQAGLNCELLVYDWSTFVDVRNNQPDKYNAFITSFSEKVLPNMNLFLSASWAGWCTDERIVNDLAAIATETDLSGAQQTWYDLQEYMWAEGVPVVKFGNTVAWGVVNKKIQGIEYFNWLVFVDAQIVQ